MICLILTFSKNRPAQLYSQLLSTRDHIHGDFKQVVIYTVKNDTYDKYQNAYSWIKEQFPEVKFVRQIDFKDDVINELRYSGAKYTMMATDDSIFIRNCHIKDCCKYDRNYVMSLRLAPHLKVMHTAHNREMKNPEFTRVDNKNCWIWLKGECEWYYPLTCDASIFETEELIELLQPCPFRTPNTLEMQLNGYLPRFIERYGLCYDESVYLNIPWNRVSHEAINPHANINESFFQKMWDQGFRIKHENYYGMIPISCHQEVNLEFTPR